MKNIFKKMALLIVLFSLTANRCANDSEEQTIDEEQANADAVFNQKNEKAITDWSNFKKTTDKLYNIAQTNLVTLKIIVDQSKGEKKLDLDAIYGKTNYNLEMLKGQLDDRDSEFIKELKQDDENASVKNAKFKESYLREMVELNKQLEEIIEK